MALKKISYSVPNLKTLVNSSNSCVYCIENCARSITVLPLHLNNIKRSVNQLLSDKVTTYDALLKGIILGHKNIKVVNHVQLSDDGNFALDYVADIYIFKPEVGNHLSGEVNKKSKDHIGVLVHSFFNVSIPRPRNDTECPKNWIGFNVDIGQTVIFEVVKVNFSGRLPFIKGKLIDLCEVDFEDRDSGIGGHESMEENTIMKDKSQNDKDVKIKKKKKKKKSEDVSHDCLQEQELINKSAEVGTSEELIDSLIKEAHNEQNNCSPEKKKRKKKKKVSGDKEETLPLLDAEPETSKSKKRKFSESESCFGTDPNFSLNTDEVDHIPIHRKKKKKKHSDSSINNDF